MYTEKQLKEKKNFWGRPINESHVRLAQEVEKDKTISKSARRHYFSKKAKKGALESKMK
jgi:hypothetical protein